MNVNCSKSWFATTVGCRGVRNRALGSLCPVGTEQSDEYDFRDGLPVGTGKTEVMKHGEVDAVSPTIVDFVSGYDNANTPNLWGGPAATPC